MASFADGQAARDRAARDGRSDTTVGTCVGYDFPNQLVKINVGGQTLSMPWAADMPFAGDSVRVLWVGNKPICIAVNGSAQGTYVSVSSGIATVTGDDGRTYLYAMPNGITFTAGDRVMLLHSKRMVGSPKYAVEPPGSTLNVPGGPPGGSSGSATFKPTQSGSYRDGAFRGQDVEVNAGRAGMYWYGTQIAATIPDSATVKKMTLQLVEIYDNIPGTPSMLGTHTQAAPSGQPTIAGVIPILDGGSINILSLANALKTGAGLGVGFDISGQTGYRAFASLASSGSIYAEWTL